MLLETSIALGFYALAMPFGYLSRRVKGWTPAWKKWTAFLGLVHTPVVPLILFVRTAHPTIEYEVLLVVVLLSGHLTGLLAWRLRHSKAVSLAQPAAE